MAMAMQFRMNEINISPGFKRYFANTSWLMGHRMLSMVVALFVGVYIALIYVTEKAELGKCQTENL